MAEVSAYAPDGVPEVTAGADLVGLLLPLVELSDGEIVAVTSKVVAKAEGRVMTGDRDALLPDETVRVVARRGPTTIVRTRHGLTLAAGGIDASNVPRGSVVLLPDDPDASARRIRAEIADRTGRNVGVVVTDTAGRAWREGQTDIAIGAAGIQVPRSTPAGWTRTATSSRSPLRRWPTRSRDSPSWPRASSEAGRSRWSGAGPTWCCRGARTARARSHW